MKQKIINILIILLFVIGAAVLLYPTVSNEWNNYVQSTLIDSYTKTVDSLSQEDYTAEWEAARAFNASISENAIGFDAFNLGSDGDAVEPTEDFYSSDYYSVLNVARDGIMGYLSIPKISIKLPIMHGTYDTFIQTALGHMNGTALPIGGEGTHSVIVGHRGLPSSKLFTDIDQLELGDKFYIHVLDETLAYQVDMISDMIEAEDIDTLSAAMAVEEGKDYVTLFTCTPYGVNTHRLLVRGTRVEYLDEDETPTGTEALVDSVKNYYMLYTLCGIIIVVILILIMRAIFKKKTTSKRE